MSEIQNQVGIITGASSGLGEATASRLAKYGAKLMLAAMRSSNQARTLKRDAQIF